MAFSVLTETGHGYTLTSTTIRLVAQTARETTQVGSTEHSTSSTRPGAGGRRGEGLQGPAASGPRVCANGGALGLSVIGQPLGKRGCAVSGIAKLAPHP